VTIAVEEITMELHINSHEWHRRMPDWPRAVCAGLVAGALLMVLEMLWTVTVSGSSPWSTSHHVAAIVMGEKALESSTFNIGIVAVALATHYVLGVVFGLVLAIIIAGFHYEQNTGMLEVLGVVFGTVLYLLNFYGMAVFFPWIADLRAWSTFIGHIIFGLTVVLTYQWLEGREETNQ
jgi:hypothetical protein